MVNIQLEKGFKLINNEGIFFIILFIEVNKTYYKIISNTL
ncbi:unnamed protein product [marine sediment metagenome]|uniref:Uncharacterized protein n=1 Tax=marine sediment metagenome TaxID=412755 RepID=X1SLZ1_9ZZZZ